MSGRKVAVLAAAVFGLIAAAAGASATPEPAAGTVKTVIATLQIGGTDGKTYVVTVTGQQRELVGQSAASEVSVGWKSCVSGRKGKPSCSTVTEYRILTTGNQFSIAADSSTARLALQLAGSRLLLRWERTADSRSFGFSIDTDGATANDPTSSGPATAAGTVFGATCHGSATVRTDYVVRITAVPALSGSTKAPRIPSALSAARRCLAP